MWRQKQFALQSMPLGMNDLSQLFSSEDGYMGQQVRLACVPEPPADVGNLWIQQKCRDSAIHHEFMKVGQRFLSCAPCTLSLCVSESHGVMCHGCVGLLKLKAS